MKKRFIVLIDFSIHAEWLLTFSYNWALQTGAELLLFHHAADPLPGLGDSEVLSRLKRDNEEKNLVKLKSFAEGVVGANPLIKYYSNSYNVSSAVMKLQELNTTDYLFVGMSDKTGIGKLVMASTVLQLTELIDSIVIVLPAAVNNLRFDTLHVGVKHAYPVDEARFDELLSITLGKIRHITFFSVLKPGAARDEVTAYLQAICARYEKKVSVSYKISEANNTAKGIKEYMLENKGILVVQKGPRNIIDIFRKFFTTEIVHYAQIPVIILP